MSESEIILDIVKSRIATSKGFNSWTELVTEYCKDVKLTIMLMDNLAFHFAIDVQLHRMNLNQN